MVPGRPDRGGTCGSAVNLSEPFLSNTVSPKKLETGLRSISAGIPILNPKALLRRIEAIGFPNFWASSVQRALSCQDPPRLGFRVHGSEVIPLLWKWTPKKTMILGPNSILAILYSYIYICNLWVLSNIGGISI